MFRIMKWKSHNNNAIVWESMTPLPYLYHIYDCTHELLKQDTAS